MHSFQGKVFILQFDTSFLKKQSCPLLKSMCKTIKCFWVQGLRILDVGQGTVLSHANPTSFNNFMMIAVILHNMYFDTPSFCPLLPLKLPLLKGGLFFVVIICSCLFAALIQRWIKSWQRTGPDFLRKSLWSKIMTCVVQAFYLIFWQHYD